GRHGRQPTCRARLARFLGRGSPRLSASHKNLVKESITKARALRLRWGTPMARQSAIASRSSRDRQAVAANRLHNPGLCGTGFPRSAFCTSKSVEFASSVWWERLEDDDVGEVAALDLPSIAAW